MLRNVSISSGFCFAERQLTLAPEHSLNWYRFIGRILGKALYEGILVDIAFAPFFLAKVGPSLDPFL